MTRDKLTSEEYQQLLCSILDILMANGIKATTMDAIASKLQMSKRTLYEIFTSKNQMVEETLRAFHSKMILTDRKILKEARNIMEAMLKWFIHHRDIISNINVDFFRDLDSRFAEAKKMSKDTERKHIQNFVEVISQGVKEGYFRDDINYMVQCRLVIIQMESLKRMEEFFPKDISIMDAYDTICVSFLRAISSPLGLATLEELLPTIYPHQKSTKQQK